MQGTIAINDFYFSGQFAANTFRLSSKFTEFCGHHTNSFLENTLKTKDDFILASKKHFTRVRYYKPSIGRFLQEDPSPGKLSNPNTVVNAYAYAGNNPWNFTDPSGNSILGGILTVIGAIGFGIAAALTGGLSAIALGAIAGGFASAIMPAFADKPFSQVLNSFANGFIFSGFIGLGGFAVGAFAKGLDLGVGAARAAGFGFGAIFGGIAGHNATGTWLGAITGGVLGGFGGMFGGSAGFDAPSKGFIGIQAQMPTPNILPPDWDDGWAPISPLH